MKWDSVATAALVACAVLTTALVVRRELVAQGARAPAEQKPAMVAHWQDYLAVGQQMGPPQAKVKIIEFADFECPFCGSFHKTLEAVRSAHRDEIALTFVHFPIPGHRFAIYAARAAECAGEQGRFEAMHDRLFEEQESFGLKPWSDYAREAAVPDSAAFDLCMKKTDAIARVEAGKRLGAQLDIQATPTIIVNGWQLTHPPTVTELNGMIEKIFAGKSPVAQRT